MSQADLNTYANLLSAIDAGESGRTIRDPATGELVGHAPEHTVGDLHRAVDTAVDKQRDWAKLTYTERCEYLGRAADAVEAAGEALAELVSREQGKPLSGPGAVWINSHGGVDPRIPFGGIKQSGYGVEFGVAGLKGLGVPQVINC